MARHVRLSSPKLTASSVATIHVVSFSGSGSGEHGSRISSAGMSDALTSSLSGRCRPTRSTSTWYAPFPSSHAASTSHFPTSALARARWMQMRGTGLQGARESGQESGAPA